METKVHIGELIYKRVQELKMTNSRFANLINCHRTNVNNIYKQETIDVQKLQKISKVLNYDFFQHYKKDYSLSAQREVIYKSIELSKEEVVMLSENVPMVLEMVVKKA